MTSERSSVALWARTLRAVTGLAIISISFGLGSSRASAASPDDRPQTANRPAAKLINVPLSFEPNQGQVASSVQFLSRGSGYALFLTPGKVVLNRSEEHTSELQSPC